MRKTLAMALAVVVAVLAVVAAGATGDPIAWAAAAVLLVGTAAVVSSVSLTPGAQRAVVGLGALVAVLAVVVAIAEFAVRGYRSDSTALLLGLAVGIGGLLVVIGVAAARSAPSPAALWQGATALAAVAVVAGVLVAATVPYLPQSRAVSFDTADAASTLSLTVPAGVENGDTLVAQVLRAGAGEVRAPGGWSLLRTTALPGGGGSVSLFTTTADDLSGPVTFTSDSSTTMLGGIGAWSHVSGVSAPGETTGTGGVVTAAPAPDDSATQVLYFVAGAGVSDVSAPDPLTSAWTVRVDNVVKATAALVTRPALSSDAAAPVSIGTSTPLGAWAAQTVVLTAE